MKIFILFLIALYFTACTSTPVAPRYVPPLAPIQTTPSVPSGQEDENVDLVGIQNFLKLNRSFQKLGYSEKSFDTCQMGYGYSSTHNCRKKYLVVIHFQLMCRNSDGTVSVAVRQSDLQPISRKSVTWHLKNAVGKIMTDNEGFGQIVMASAESQRFQRLRLVVGENFLFLKAGELEQMMTPSDWCD